MLKKIIAILILICVGLSLFACAPAKFTPEEENKFLEEFDVMIFEPAQPEDMMKKLDSAVGRLSENEASYAIDGLLYAIHQFIPEMEEKTATLSSELIKYHSDGIDLNSEKAIDEINDEMVKALLKELHKKKLVLEVFNSDIFVKADMNLILDKYAKYMNDDLKAVAQFSADENMNEFFSKEDGMFDLDTVANRILKIEENMNTFTDSIYIPSMIDSKVYYYQIYFGLNNEYVVDNKDNVKPAVINHYKETMDKYPDSVLAIDIAGYLEKLEETSGKLNDDAFVYLNELTSSMMEE